MEEKLERGRPPAKSQGTRGRGPSDEGLGGREKGWGTEPNGRADDLVGLGLRVKDSNAVRGRGQCFLSSGRGPKEVLPRSPKGKTH